MAAEVPQADWVQTANAIFFVAFTVAVAFGAFTTTRRLIRYWRRGERAPLLLLRDVVARNTLAIPLGAILLARVLVAFGVNLSSLGRNPVWVFSTGGIAVLGVIVYDVFEVLIERDDRVRQLEWEAEQLRKGERISRR